MSEIIFDVREDGATEGYLASALGFEFHIEAESLEDCARRSGRRWIVAFTPMQDYVFS